MNAYAIADSIYKLQRLNAAGICFAGKKYLGSFINLTREATTKNINKLVEEGLVVRIGVNLRTTEEWDRNFEDSEMDFDYE